MDAPCPEESVFADLLAGRLSTGAAAALQAHVDGCSACFALLLALGRAEEGAPDPGGSAAELAATRAEDFVPPQEFAEYRLLRPLGQGAMGQVYLAQDRLLDRQVAIKFLATRELDQTARERFQVEARAIARLQHPNVVTIFRTGEAAGRPFLVSEYVPGRSLRELDRPLPWVEALALAVGLCRGLSAAHQRGVLHRDIKPANAILAADGAVKLLDFGLAKLLEALPAAPVLAQALGRSLAASEDLALTQPGVVLGTPLYLAPELLEGAEATAAADVYALGAVLYELLAGHPPLRAATLPALLRLIRERGALPLWVDAPNVPAALGAIVDRCLQRDPAARYPSGVELLQALEPLLAAARPPAAAAEPSVAARARLEAAAAEWARLGMPDEALWAAPQLREAQPLEALTPLGEAFLVRSRRALQRRGRAAWLLGGLALAVTVALGWPRPGPEGEAREARRAAQQRLELGLSAAAQAQRPGQEAAALARALLVLDLLREERGGLLLGLGASEGPALEALGAGLDGLTQALPLRGHRAPLGAAAFSLDGARVATVSEDGSGRLWDAGGGALLARLQPAPVADALRLPGPRAGAVGSEELLALAFAPQAPQYGGGALALAGRAGVIWLYDGSDGSPRGALRGHQGSIAALAFAADGARLASAADDGARLWLRTAQGFAPQPGAAPLPGGGVTGVVFSERGGRGEEVLLVTAGQDGAARVFAARDGALRATLRGHSQALTAARLSPDGARLATGSADGSARLWDLASGQGALLAEVGERVRGLAFSADGALLVLVRDDGAAQVFAGREGRPLRRIAATDGVAFVAAAFAPEPDSLRGEPVEAPRDRRQAQGEGSGRAAAGGVSQEDPLFPGALALARGDGAVWLYARASLLPGPRLALDEGPVLTFAAHRARVRSLAFAPDGRRLVSASEDESASVLALGARSSPPLAVQVGAAREVRAAEGRVLTAGGGEARLWEDGTLRPLAAPWDAPAAVGGPAPAVGDSAPPPATAVALSSDGALVLRGAADGSARLWSLRSGRELAALSAEGKGAAAALAVTSRPGGALALVARGPEAQEALLYALDEGRPARLLQRLRGAAQVVALSGDGRSAASAGRDGAVRLWDSEGRALAVFAGHGAAVRALAFSGDGAWLWSAGEDGSARGVPVRAADRESRSGDPASQAVLLYGQSGPLAGIAADQRGERVLTLGVDGGARLWDTRSLQPLWVRGGAAAGALSADGQRVLLLGHDGVLHGHPAPLPVEAAVRAACAVLRAQPESPQVARVCARSEVYTQ